MIVVVILRLSCCQRSTFCCHCAAFSGVLDEPLDSDSPDGFGPQVVLVGDVSVGKPHLLSRYMKD